MLTLDKLSLADITPPNIAQDKTISSLITALDPQFQEISQASLVPLIFARIDELPEPVIDLLAVQLHVDFYDLAGTMDMKRESVKGSLLWHMHKGTEWAIHEALRMLDIKAEFVHWHDDDSPPYTFKLRAIISGDYYRTKGRDKLISSLRRAVDESKAARSYMTGLETVMHFTDNVALYAGVIPFLSGNHTIYLSKPETPGETKTFWGVVASRQGHVRLGIQKPDTIYCSVLPAAIMIHERDINLGVDLDVMQELLRQFEARIMSAIDQYESNIMQTLETHHKETTDRLDEFYNLMCWKGPDER